MKIIKKNIAVLLTLCMLLSSWVFFAPEHSKAHAVEQEEYKITIYGSVDNAGDAESNKFTLTYIRPNGSTGTVGETNVAESNHFPYEYTVDGIPKKLEMRVNGYAAATAAWYITEVVLETNSGNVSFFKGKMGDEVTWGWNHTDITFDFEQGRFTTDSGTHELTSSVPASKPVPTVLTIESRPEDVTIPNEAGETNATGCSFYVKDQYGVRMGSKYYTVSLQADDETKRGSVRAVKDDANSSDEIEAYEIQVAEGAKRLETNYDEKTGTWGGGGGEGFSEPMTLTVTGKYGGTPLVEPISLPLIQPTYSVYFADGADDGENTATIEPEEMTGKTYSMALEELPVASKTGYTFVGYYENPGMSIVDNPDDPETIDALGTKVTAETIVNNDKNTPGSTSDKAYKAVWTPAPCTVQVMNNRRQVVMTYTGRYGYKLGASANSGYNEEELLAAVEYVKTSGESGPYNNLQPSGFGIIEASEYISSDEQAPSEDYIGEDFRDVTLTGNITVMTYYKQETSLPYTVGFYDCSSEATGNAISEKQDYTYGDTIEPPAEASVAAYSDDDTFEYEFAGWAKQRHTGDTHYFVDVKSDGTLSSAIPLVDVTATKVTADVNFVAVYSRKYKEYAAVFHYSKDNETFYAFEQENTYHYDRRITAPTTVTRTVDENQTITEDPTANFIAGGWAYSFDGWYTEKEGGVLVNFDPKANDPNARMKDYVEIDPSAGSYGREYWAHYERGEHTANTIAFYTEGGALLSSHDVPYSTENSADVEADRTAAEEALRERNLYTYDSKGTRYTFTGWRGWVNRNQTGEEFNYTAIPETPAHYYPVYEEKPLHTLWLYNNGTEVASFLGVADEALSIDSSSGAIQAPTRAGDMYSATYVFKGWSSKPGYLYEAEEELIDLASYHFPSDDSTLDHTLYAHFEAQPIEYTVKFLKEDGGDVIEEYNLHYGDEVNVPDWQTLSETLEPDLYYKYSPMGWNLEPSEVCDGNATYYLTYHKSYVYHTVRWLDYSGSLFKEDRYIYNELLRRPYEEPKLPTHADPSFINVFDGWVYVNSDGSEAENLRENADAHFSIGQRLGGADQSELDGGSYTGPLTPQYWESNENVVTLRATLEETEHYVTVTQYDGIEATGKPYGSVFKTVRVRYGQLFGGLEFSESGHYPPYTNTKHSRFSQWKRLDGNSSVSIASDYPFTEDCSIVAAFVDEEHGRSGVDNAWNETEIKAPTFTQTGRKDRTCTAPGCGYTEQNSTIPVLKDTVAPTGRLLVKDHIWNSNEAVTPAQDPIPAALHNLVIVNAQDTADVNEAHNPNGEGTGVAQIDFALVRAADAPEDASTLSVWYTGYIASGSGAANASLTVGNLMGETDDSGNRLFPQLTGNDQFVIFARIRDRARQDNVEAGNDAPNLTYLRSDVLILDTEYPQITITSTDGLDTSIRHCEDATLKITGGDLDVVTINAGSTWQLSGESVDLAEYLNEEAQTLTVTARGQYQIVATDKAGNVTKKNFEILGSHKLTDYMLEPTCSTTGLKGYRCTVCGWDKEDAKQVLTALGHSYTTKTIEPTCTEEGKTYRYCTRCGEKEEGSEATLEALGHDWQNAYVVRAATCNTQGVKRYDCSRCSKTKNESFDALDKTGQAYAAALEADRSASAAPYGHSLYARQKIAATCTRDGEVTRMCKYCRTNFVVEVLPALGHSPSTKNYYIIQEATCEEPGSRAPYCANGCGTILYTEPVVQTFTVTDEDGQTSITKDGETYALTKQGKARAMVESTPDYWEFSGESAEETVYEGRALSALYVYQYSTGEPEPSLKQHNDVAGATKFGDYDLTEMHDYVYTLGETEITITGEPGQSVIMLGDNSYPLTDLGQTRAKDASGHYLYRYDLNDPYQYLYAYTVDDETRYYQSNSADETEYDGHALTALYVYRYNTAAQGDAPVYETCNAPENEESYNGYPLTALYTYTYTVEDPGEFGTAYVQTVPKLGHLWKYVETVAPTEESVGYDLYRCSRCEQETHRNEVPATVYCDVHAYDILLDESGETVNGTDYANVRVASGTDFLKTQLSGSPSKAEDPTFRYVFKGWSLTKQDLKALKDAIIAADDEEAVPLPATVTFPLRITEDTTLYAVYQPDFVNYTVSLYNEGGVSKIRDVGYLHIGNVISPAAPEKPEDEITSYVFGGWVPLTQEGDSGASMSITVDGDASYRATYVPSGVVKKYKVFWMYGSTRLGEAEVFAAEPAVYPGNESYGGATPDAIKLGLNPTAAEHYVFSGWDKDTTRVTSNMRVYAQFAPQTHTMTTESTQQSCTTGTGTKRTCTICGFHEEYYTNEPLGHAWKDDGDPVYPVVNEDGTYEPGHQAQVCERCGETRELELKPVPLNVTVKTTDGTMLEGAKVTVYFVGSGKVMSAFSAGDGVASLLVPYAGAYTLMLEYDGKQIKSDVSVGDSGEITQGSAPVIGSAQTAGCPKNCTCHQSGLWPTIYRAVHTFIYWVTRTKCCPDADYI